MSTTFFISDLHFGHAKILDFSPMRGGTNIEEHNEWIIKQYNSVVTKRDTVFILGDVAFGEEPLKLMGRLRGNKALVRGNHDRQATITYTKYFSHIYGIFNKDGYWLSHAPIHPQELRGKKNIHGHVHQNYVLDEFGKPDSRYINVCVEALNGVPISFDEIKKL